MSEESSAPESSESVEEETSFIEVAESTMIGDLMSLVIDELKNMPDVWQKLPESTQQMFIDRVAIRITDAVMRATNIIFSQDNPAIEALVEQVVVKEGYKAVLTIPKSNPHRHELADAQGSTVLIIVADAAQFSDGIKDIKPDPDQPELDLNEQGEPEYEGDEDEAA